MATATVARPPTADGARSPAIVHAARTSFSPIVDDLDPFFPFPCLVAPCEYGTGFYLGGPDQGWPEAEDGRNTMYDGHAYYTYAASQWQGTQTNNWASWTLEEPLPGTWEIQAYIPRIYDTTREPTRRARYVIARPGGEVERELDHTRGPGWLSLGTVDYGTDEDLPRVEIRDLTADAHSADGRAKVVLVDAVRWVEPTGGTEPVLVDAYLYGRPDGASFPVGSTARICFSVSRPVRIRWTYCNPQGPGCSVIAEWDDDGTGACTDTDPLQQVGIRSVQIEALSGSSVLASDETWFNVVSGATAVVPTTAPPTPEPPPAPTARPTTEPTAAPAKDKVALLVHGYLGFSQDGGNDCAQRPIAYKTGMTEFGRLAATLHEDRYNVYLARWRTSWSSTSDLPEARACLARQITWLREQYPGKQITLVAHSMGGLVSRAYVEATRDASVDHLVTFGSPHHGVQLDLLMRALSYLKSEEFKGCKADPGTCALSFEAMKRYNAQNVLFPSTRYHLVGGTGNWLPTQKLLGLEPFEDDGLIVLESSVGAVLDTSIVPGLQRWETGDLHTTAFKSLTKKAYENSEESVACLRTSLNMGSTGTTCRRASSAAAATTDGAAAPLAPAGPSQGGYTQAFTPVQAFRLAPGATDVRTVIVDGAAATFGISANSENLLVQVESPSGLRITRDDPGGEVPGATYQEDPLLEGSRSVTVSVPNPENGRWQVRLIETGGRTTSVVLFGSMLSQVSVALRIPGEIAADGSFAAGIDVARAGRGEPIGSASVTVEGVDGTLPVTVIGTGQFRAQGRAPSVPGYYVVTAVVRGVGEGFEREVSGLLVVVESTFARLTLPWLGNG